MHATRPRPTLSRAAACLSLLATAAAVHAQPLELYVDDDAPAGGDGLSWPTAFRDLRDALEFPLPAGTHSRIVKLAAGIFLPDRGSLSRESSFVVASGTTVLGGFAGVGHADPDHRDPTLHRSTLSGDLLRNDQPGFVNRHDNTRHVVVASGSMNILDGLTIRGGWAEYQNQQADIVGGGVQLRGRQSHAVFRDCVIEDNMAGLGGGVGSRWRGSALFERTVVRNNLATWTGGGVHLGTIEIQASQFSRNTAWWSGGAMFASGSVGAFNSLFVGNSAGRGGVCEGVDASVQFKNCTLVENMANAGSVYRAIRPDGGAFVSCIFDSNGPAPLLSASQFSVFRMTACLVNGPISNHVLTSASVLGGGYLQTGPRFVDPLGLDGVPASGDEDYSLSPSSLAIDAAADELVYPDSAQLDLASHYRIHDDPGMPNIGIGANGALDIGAYEFQGTSCRADHDGDTAISVPDIFSYLSDWFAQRLEADFDRDRSIEVDDLFHYLSAWFAGC